MNELHSRAVSILDRCTFLPGSFDKKFVRSMSSDSYSAKDLTENQAKYLWKLVWAYRKQHRNKWFTYYAKDRVAPDKPEPKIDWLD